MKATTDFINSLDNFYELNKTNYLWRNVSPDLIRPLFQKFKVPDSLVRVEPNNLLQFIDVQIANGELTSWSVGVMSKIDTKERFKIDKNGNIIDIGYWVRRNGSERTDATTFFIKKNHIISPRDEFIDLSKEQHKAALERTIEFHRHSNKEYKNDYPKGEIVRNEFRDPKNPLLLIYFLDPKEAELSDRSVPLVGFAISFPRSKFNSPVSYAINRQLLPLFNIDDQIENDDED